MNNSVTPSTPTAPRLGATAKRRCRRIAALTIAATMSLMGALHVDAADPGVPGASADSISERSIASFEGREIDLSKDWEEATACWVDEFGETICFRSEEEMDQALVAAGKVLSKTNPPSDADRREGLRAASCSSSLRLYRNNSYGGSVVYLSQRSYWINLSWYGFDNVVSSYRIGGCSATFRSGSGGSGTTYWGGTWAWAARSSMPEWDNVLSSVKIN